MDRYRANSNPNVKNPATTSAAPGFDSLYASLFGSGDRQNFNTNQPAPPSANESLYPSSPYQPHQMPSNQQMHSGNVGQTPNGIPYGTHPSAKWHRPSRPSPSSPQHQEEPYSIGPFNSIWSMKSNEAGAGAGVQHQQQKNWSSDTSAAPGYRDSHPSMPATNGIPFGGYEQHAYGGNEAGFHGNPGGVASPGCAWSTHDGVNDGNVQGVPDWRWQQSQYAPSTQSEHWQHGVDRNMENHAVNEWELHDVERARKNREEDMKGRQERREWKKKGINHPEFIPDSGFHKQKSLPNPPPKTSPNDKVVASFLEKYRSDDPVAFTPGSSVDSDEQIIVGTKVEVRESKCPSNEELGTSSAEKESDTNASDTVQASDRECHISGKSPSPDPEQCNPTEGHQETTSNVDSSDLADRINGREGRSLSDPVTVQEVQQNNSVKSGSASRKALSNGKIRPGKRKPKLPRDKRKNMVAPAEKSEIKSCEKQTVQIETKGQPENIEKNINLGSKETSKNPKPSSKPVNNISSESIVQSPKPTPVSMSKPQNTSKSQKASSKSSCQNVPLKHHSSDNKSSGDCSSTTPCDSKTDTSSGIDIQFVSVKENIDIKQDNKSADVPSCKLSKKLDKDQSIKSLEKNHISISADKNEKTRSCVNDSSTVEKGDCSDLKTPKEKSTGMTNVQKHDVQTVHQKDNLDTSRHVRNTVSSKSPNVTKNDVGKSTRSIPVQNQTPSCELKSNITQKNVGLTDEAKSASGNKLPTITTKGNSNNVNDKTTSGIKQEQEKKKTKDSGLFFDPKRIFGGQKTVKTATQKLSKELDKSRTPPAERIPKNSNLTDFQSFQARGNVNVPATKVEHSSALPDPPLVQGPANPTKPVRSGTKEGEMNGTLLSRKLPPSAAQTVPSSSAKDALASKAPTMKADPVSSQQHSGDPTSPAEPRPARMYSYKKDDKTGFLRRSSDPKVEEQQSSRRGSGGAHSSADEAKGERRCSGDSHMDGFHHPFGCSANCYRTSSTPSSSQSNSRRPSSGANQSTGSSASSEKKENPKPAGQKAQHTFPQPENSSPVFEASAFAELREGLKSSWLSKEKRKDDQKQRQEKIQKEHLEKVLQQEKHDQRIKREKLEQERREQKRQQEKQEQERQQEKLEQKRQQQKLEQKRQQEKRQESASQHAKRPTRATYSKPKDPKATTSEPQDKRPGTSQTRSGRGTSTEQPRGFCSCHTEASAQTASQEDSTEESDMEEDLNRGLADEWWFKFGKKFTRGVCWLVLFSVLLCLVLLSFLLALARDTCKFAYHRGWDLWTWYNEKPPQDDEFFSSHRSHHTGFQDSHQSDTGGGDGGSFFGFGRNQQGETGGGTSWSHTGAGTHHQEAGARAKQPRKKQTQNIELPSTELAAIRRLLSCDPGNYYQIVGVAEDATEDDIKKFYRKQCMLVHPDKTDQPQANEAFQVLQKAYAILSDPAKRSEYHYELDYKEQIEDKVNDFYKKMAEMADSMPCGVCKKSHKRYETDLPTHAARYCATHDTRHPVKDGALWKETANLGFKIYVFLCDEHTVYDVTEWAACQNLEWLEPNTCRLLCKVKRGGRTGQQRRQQHQAGYEEMFDNIFGSGAFRQFQSSANQQGHNGNHHHGNSHPGSGGSHSHPGSGSSHGHSQQGGGSRNKGFKKSRKKKK